MAANRCPGCYSDIGIDDLNLKEDVGVCRGCGVAWKLSEIALSPDDAQADAMVVQEVPDGCWVNDLGDRTVVGASCRSGMGWFFALFATFWNGITGIFVLAALGGLYVNLVGPLPAWYPFTNTNFSGPGHNGTIGTMSMSATVGLCLFLIPFVFAGVLTGSLALVGMFGRIDISLRGDTGTIFTGVWGVGWKREFAVSQVRSVKITDSGATSNGKTVKHIQILADKQRSFGLFLTDTRRLWLCGAVRKLLIVAH